VENRQTKSQSQGLLSIVAANHAFVKKAAFATAVAKQVGVEYLHNAKYYNDFVKFNFCGVKSDKQYRKVCYYDLPIKERDRLNTFRRTYFSNVSTFEIYRRLGVSPSETNKTMPVESKWAYTYFKKYGHWNYSEYNSVTDSEILRPLNAEEAKEYSRMF
jgi:hypothetical protein